MPKAQQPKSAVTTVPATEVRQHFGEMLKRVYRDKEQLVVEKDGLPIAAIVSLAEFEEYRRMKTLALLDQLGRRVGEELQAKGMTEQQLLADLETTQQEVFAQKYGRAAKSRRRKTA